jgi:hypothetical protein
MDPPRPQSTSFLFGSTTFSMEPLEPTVSPVHPPPPPPALMEDGTLWG